jgi:hypothetical protein
MTRPVKAKLATLDQLDGRTIAAKQAREVISSIETDLGGRESISTARRALIENAAVLGAVVQDMGAKWISGEQIDLALSQHCPIHDAGCLNQLASIGPLGM